jgi:magnesium chelatase accessory protein
LLNLLNIKSLKTIVSHSAGTTLAIEFSNYNKQIEVEEIIGINPSLVPPPFHFTMALSPLISPFITSETSVSLLSKIINNSTIIEKLLDSTGSNLKDPIKRDRYARLFNNKKHLKGALNFMAETDVISVLQNANSAKTKFFFIIGIKDSWVRSDSLKNIFSKYFPQAKILELDGGHLLNETHAKELCKLILQELTHRSNSI